MLNTWGANFVLIFYVLILVVGIWASYKRNTANDSVEELILAGRNLGLLVGIMSMTATWVGAGYLNGTAEAIYTTGLIWCQAPFGYALSLVIGGTFFAKKMREKRYITMLDPLQYSFGRNMGGLLFLPALCGEVFWAAAILAALGATLRLIIDMNHQTSIIFSACIAVFYTALGGLYSVAYTDVIQLINIFVGLWMCIPFAWTNEHVVPLSSMDVDWMGEVKHEEYFLYLDYALLLTLEGIPWQVYCTDRSHSKKTWNETDYWGPYSLTPDESSMILPMVLHYLTTDFISFLGLGAVSAAVLSSVESSILSASSMFARNNYKMIFRPTASGKEMIWVLRISILVVGASAAIMALNVYSIYGLWSLSSDLVYIILFPQLLMVVHFQDHCNTYGSLAAFLIALLLRLLSGEPLLGLEPFIHFPGWDEIEQRQLFPFRTVEMIIFLITWFGVSFCTKLMFVSPKYDVFHWVYYIPNTQNVAESEAVRK